MDLRLAMAAGIDLAMTTHLTTSLRRHWNDEGNDSNQRSLPQVALYQVSRLVEVIQKLPQSYSCHQILGLNHG